MAINNISSLHVLYKHPNSEIGAERKRVGYKDINDMHKAKRLVGLLNRTEQRARYSTHTKGPETVPTLPDGTLSTFRSRAFQIETPALLPRGHFTSLPASQKWFKKSADVAQSTFLDVDYLSQYGTAIVPLEITSDGHFAQIEQPLQFFIE